MPVRWKSSKGTVTPLSLRQRGRDTLCRYVKINSRTVIATVLLVLGGLLLVTLPSNSAQPTATVAAPWKKPRPVVKRYPVIQSSKCGVITGKRVQLVYLRGEYQEDRLPVLYYQLTNTAMAANSPIVDASLRNGGVRRDINFVTDSSCRPTILPVVIREGDNLQERIIATDPRPVDHTYIVFDDQNNYYCGMSNVGTGRSQEFAWIGRDCWNTYVVLHEFMHSIGAVTRRAPNATIGYHCTEGQDYMCYDDGSSPEKTFTTPCATLVLDCNNNDYFDARKRLPLGSYLRRNPRANTANSPYLLRNGVQQS